MITLAELTDEMVRAELDAARKAKCALNAAARSE